MGTLDYLDRRPHKPSTGGGTFYLHTTPIEVDATQSATIEVIITQNIIEVEVTDG
jgi:hypothetical protein